MKGEKVYDDYETKIDLNIDAFIPPSYIKNEVQKINVYKQIASIETNEDYSDILDELIDRFGEPPKKVVNLITIALLKAMAHKVWITEISEVGTNIKIQFYEKAEINPAGIAELVEKYKGRLKFIIEKTPHFLYLSPRKITNIDEYKKILEEILTDIETLKL